MQRATLILVLIIIAAGIVFFLLKNSSRAQNLVSSQIDVTQKLMPESTPIPFVELTIPYLRERKYESKLGELSLVSNNGSYNSYLTSYSSDGFKINGLLTKPVSTIPEGGFPAIVFVHGYIPPSQYATLERYTDHVDYLARNGFVVFKIDLRGNGESEGEAGGAYYSSDYVIDTLNAYAALQSTEFVNPNKIGLWGHSMAGNVLSRSFAVKPEIPAVVIWAGAGFSYLDLAEFGIQDSSYRPQPSDSERQRKRAQIRQVYGDPKDGNPFWEMVAFTNYLNDLKGAIQLDHAIDDQTVSIEYSRSLNKLLDQTKVSHQLNEYPNGGHNMTGASFTQAMQNTVEFFNKYLD